MSEPTAAEQWVRSLGKVIAQRDTAQAQADALRTQLAEAQEQLHAVGFWRGGLEDDITALTADRAALRTRCAELEQALAETDEALREMPELVLANERKNPAWSKAELWGIERDIIPSIRALCMAAMHRAALRNPSPAPRAVVTRPDEPPAQARERIRQ